jgi:hypothetical protein
MWPYVIAIGTIVLIVLVYVWSYNLNEKTKKPEDCEDLECTGCNANNCAHRK